MRATAADLIESVKIGTFWQNETVVFVLWVILAAILLALFYSTWMFWRNEIFKEHLGWVVLEIRIPREIAKTARAMEQVLYAIHSLRNRAADLGEWLWQGEITRWYSLEVVSFGGEVHFYIRTYYKQRPIIESAFYAYYPDLEIVEVDDYVKARFPKTLQEVHDWGYDMWGAELNFKRPDAYPLKVHTEFETVDEEKQVDPVANLVEVMGKIHREEIMAVQIIISPALDEWRKEWESLVDKLRDAQRKDKMKAKTAFIGGPLPAFGVKEEDADLGKNLSRLLMRSPGETDVLKAVEDNLSKPAFETIIRYIYFSPKSIFYDSFPRRAMLGAFNQYADLSLNFFHRNHGVETRTKIWNFPYLFPHKRNDARKYYLLYKYQVRELPHETFMGKLLTSTLFHWNFHSKTMQMSTSSLASVFHPPSNMVLTAPHIKRVESRKAGPPAGIAIFGEEKNLDKFK